MLLESHASSVRPLLADEAPSFLLDVMPVLSKSGCNAGTCHGNANGKGGFSLSLRGFDPAADHRAITQEFAGRRIDRIDPESSLLLRKPVMDLAHQGGKRFGQDSWQYEQLKRWIAAGAPGPRSDEPHATRLVVAHDSGEFDGRQIVLVQPVEKLQLRVTAEFSDGAKRDVTPLPCTKRPTWSPASPTTD